MRVAVTDLKADGVPERLPAVFTEAVVTELRKLQRVSVVSTEEIRAMLDFEAQRQLAGCDADDSCIAEIADSLGVDIVVTGTLARVAGNDIVGLKRIDQREAKVVGSLTKTVPAGDGEAILALVGPVVEELFGDVPLRSGVTRGVDRAVARKLSPPPVPVWGFGTAAVATGVVALAGAGVVGVNALLAGQLDERLRQAVENDTALKASDIRDEQATVATTAWAAVSTLTAAGVLAAGTGLLALFTDWNNDAEALGPAGGKR